MKTKQMTIVQFLAVCALLTVSLFAVAAQTRPGSQKKQLPPQSTRTKACCTKNPDSGGLTDCNKPMPNGLCSTNKVKANCDGKDVNGAPTNCKE